MSLARQRGAISSCAMLFLALFVLSAELISVNAMRQMNIGGSYLTQQRYRSPPRFGGQQQASKKTERNTLLSAIGASIANAYSPLREEKARADKAAVQAFRSPLQTLVDQKLEDRYGGKNPGTGNQPALRRGGTQERLRRWA
jgi:hypothetical protein